MIVLIGTLRSPNRSITENILSRTSGYIFFIFSNFCEEDEERNIMRVSIEIWMEWRYRSQQVNLLLSCKDMRNVVFWRFTWQWACRLSWLTSVTVGDSTYNISAQLLWSKALENNGLRPRTQGLDLGLGFRDWFTGQSWFDRRSAGPSWHLLSHFASNQSEFGNRKRS